MAWDGFKEYYVARNRKISSFVTANFFFEGTLTYRNKPHADAGQAHACPSTPVQSFPEKNCRPKNDKQRTDAFQRHELAQLHPRHHAQPKQKPNSHGRNADDEDANPATTAIRTEFT